MTEDKKNKKIIWICGAALAFAVILFSVLVMNFGKPEKTAYDVVIFGDSIMAYAHDDSSVAWMINNKTGLSVCDLSFGGTAMAYSSESRTPGSHKSYLCMAAISNALLADDLSVQKNIRQKDPATDYFDRRVSEMEAADIAHTDIAIIEHCINDYNSDIPIGDATSTSEYTYCGAIRVSVENLRKINPDIRIILVTPTGFWLEDNERYDESNGEGTLSDYVAAQKMMAEELGTEFIDLYHIYETHSEKHPIGDTGHEVIGYYYTVDGTHPNYYGRDAISDVISEYISGNTDDI